MTFVEILAELETTVRAAAVDNIIFLMISADYYVC